MCPSDDVPTRLGLFDAFGLEIEYMVVDRDSGAVVPAADRLLTDAAGQVANSRTIDGLAWSNELAAHVIELKCAEPVASPADLAERLHAAVIAADSGLADQGLALLPGAMHPWMDPRRETVLWQHEDHDLYAAFDRIFDCRRHGWGNLQSVHLNLPFADDSEFRRLHAAVRCILPLIPGLSAASPWCDGRVSGLADTRLWHYRHHCDRVPAIVGQVIPELVHDRTDYRREIFDPIKAGIEALDPDGILEDEWLNARGAIARFERGSVEIRLIDAQESPRADCAVAMLVAAAVRALVEERWCSLAEQEAMGCERLAMVFDQAITEGSRTLALDRELVQVWIGTDQLVGSSLGTIWSMILEACKQDPWLPEPVLADARRIVAGGCLADRLLAASVSRGPDQLSGIVTDLRTGLLDHRLFGL